MTLLKIPGSLENLKQIYNARIMLPLQAIVENRNQGEKASTTTL